VTLRLRDGFIHTTDATAGAEYQTHFQFYDVNLDLRQMIAGARPRERDPKELTLGQLRRAIEAKRAAGQPFVPELIEYHRKFSIPFACVVFGLAAVPLGVQPVRAARSRGFTLSLAMIFVYYILLSIGQALAEHRILPTVVGLWLPNAVFAVLGGYLFVQAARERTSAQLERLQAAVAAVRGKVLGWLEAEAPS
jgi:lipopolysaccharide export system permease protein